MEISEYKRQLWMLYNMSVEIKDLSTAYEIIEKIKYIEEPVVVPAQLSPD